KTGPAAVTAGTNVTYTVSISNSGPSDAQSVRVTDAVPAGTTFVSATQTSGPAFQSTTPGAGGTGTVVFFDPAPFAPSASATFTIVVAANASDADGSTLSNTATISSATTNPNPNTSATSNATVN